MADHDYRQYYHCSCLDDDEHAEHDDSFYHCTCIEDGFSESEAEESEKAEET